MQGVKKCRYVQVAQIDKIRQKRLDKSEKGAPKVIHNSKPEKPEKWSYTLSYSRYPQKFFCFLKGNQAKKRTTVL